MPDLPLIPGTLAEDCYPASPQSFYDEMFAKGHAVMPDITGILIQDASPDPIYRGNKGWIPTSGGVPIFPGYVFIWHATVGHWVSRNPIDASDPSRRIYVGSSASIGTYDGGDAGAPGIGSGPMWEIDTLFDGRTPVGVGTIPTSSPVASIVSPLDTTDSLGGIGQYKHVLTALEMNGHYHGVGDDGPPDGNDAPHMISRTWNIAPATLTERVQDSPGAATWGDGPPFSAGTMSSTDPLANSTPSDGHNTMQPYIGVFFIKRTIRQFYVMG